MSEKDAAVAKYVEDPGWEQMPHNARHLDVANVAIGPDDRVYLLTRHDTGVWIYERDGTFVRKWTSDLIRNSCHGIGLAPNGDIYVVDWLEHFVARHDQDGAVIEIIGTPNEGSNSGVDRNLPYPDWLWSIQRPAGPFNGPTNLAFGADGSFFVSDGYFNASIHRFAPDGTLLKTWGGAGSAPGQFLNPHGISVTLDGRVVVADRENHRVQIFNFDGEVLSIVPTQRPAAAAINPRTGY
jgi:streptogramin lyase